MSRPRINTNASGEGCLVLLFLLVVGGGLQARYFPPRGGTPSPWIFAAAGGVIVVAALAWFLGPRLSKRLMGGFAFDLAAAVVMAFVGGFLVFCASVAVLGLGTMLLLAWVGLGQLALAALCAALVLAYVAAGFWAGWRVGTADWAIGAAVGLAITAWMLPSACEEPLAGGFVLAAIAVAGALLSAVGGHVGAAWFRRHDLPARKAASRRPQGELPQ